MAAHPVQVVKYLLDNEYHLAAFELMLEMQESETEPDGFLSLSKFFQDERRFPAESLAKYEDADGKAFSFTRSVTRSVGS
jgi:hypothetical protein